MDSEEQTKELYFGSRDNSNNFIPFFANNKKEAMKMAKHMKLNSFGRLVDIVVLDNNSK